MAELAQLAKQLAQHLEKLLAETVTPADLRGCTRLLVLQGTPFCNIACDYCYLPDRDHRDRMNHATIARAVAWTFEHGVAADPLMVVWHAGEPLTLPVAWYSAAFDAVRAAAPPQARLCHAVQTNATLIDNAWCDLFLAHRVQVGVSIDGPARLHDLRRRTRAGGGTHAAALRGLRLLQRRGVPVHAICVVTEAALEAAEEIVEFFRDEGVERLGINVEEAEGVNRHSSLERPDAVARFGVFLERLIARAEGPGRKVVIREQEGLLGLLREPGFGEIRGNDENTPFEILTITRTGDIVTFSPELAGFAHPRHGSFVLGNVHTTPLPEILASSRFRALWGEVRAGIADCAATCTYFRLCRGGAPANKLAECGTMAATETQHCRLTRQAVADVVLRRLEARLDGERCP